MLSFMSDRAEGSEDTASPSPAGGSGE
jgi:hypothetical protein